MKTYIDPEFEIIIISDKDVIITSDTDEDLKDDIDW